MGEFDKNHGTTSSDDRNKTRRGGRDDGVNIGQPKRGYPDVDSRQATSTVGSTELGSEPSTVFDDAENAVDPTTGRSAGSIDRVNGDLTQE